jgi:hypothetical protein
MPTSSKTTLVNRALQLRSGCLKHFANASTLTFASASLTPAQIEASLQTLVDLRMAVDASKATTQAKVAEEASQAPALLQQLQAFAAFVKITFANSPDVLADFGLKPNKVRSPQTLEQRTVAVARNKATRAARHTMGTQQKKAVKGTITTIATMAPSAVATIASSSGTAVTPSNGTPIAPAVAQAPAPKAG